MSSINFGGYCCECIEIGRNKCTIKNYNLYAKSRNIIQEDIPLNVYCNAKIIWTEKDKLDLTLSCIKLPLLVNFVNNNMQFVEMFNKRAVGEFTSFLSKFHNDYT